MLMLVLRALTNVTARGSHVQEENEEGHLLEQRSGASSEMQDAGDDANEAHSAETDAEAKTDEAKAGVIFDGWQDTLRRRVRYPSRKSLSNPSPAGVLLSDTAPVCSTPPPQSEEGDAAIPDPSSDEDRATAAAAAENSTSKKIPYWDTLGRCRVPERLFSWPSCRRPPGNGDAGAGAGAGAWVEPTGVVGYDASLGRAYYSSFVHGGEEFRVGDFVATRGGGGRDAEYFRILAAFQATKSFMGYWNCLDWDADPPDNSSSSAAEDGGGGGGGGGDDPIGEGMEEIQKRGHPYMIACALTRDAPTDGDESRRDGGDDGRRRPGRNEEASAGGGETARKRRRRKKRRRREELCLCPDGGSSPGHVLALPEWLGEPFLKLRKVSVQVIGARASEEADGGGAPEKGGGGPPNFICRRALERRGPEKLPLPSTRQLTRDQRSLLTYDTEDLFALGLLPTKWDDRFEARQVEFVVEDRPELENDGAETSGGRRGVVPMTYTSVSSDDSDDFEDSEDEEEEQEESQKITSDACISRNESAGVSVDM